ncbi:M24 family metallopeptidase [bacterium]
MKKMYKTRLSNFKKLLKKNEIDNYLETKEVNIRYLTGFAQAPYPLLVGLNSTYIFIPEMLHKQFLSVSPVSSKIHIIIVDNTFLKAFKDIINKNRIKNIGFCSSTVSVSLYNNLKRAVSLKNTHSLVEQLRIIKDEIEIKYISKACRKTVEIMKKCPELVKIGNTEINVMRNINTYLRGYCDDLAFSTITAFGAHTSYPHHLPSNRKLSNSDIMLIDCGCRYKGYCSDLTRVFFLDKIKASQIRLKDIYKAVLYTQEYLIDYIRPGILAKDIDLLARKLLARYNLDQYFIHSTGHGLGLEIHEEPGLNKNSTQVLKQGMVLTIEPGVYINRLGGIRIEDTVLITNKGAKVLTKL